MIQNSDAKWTYHLSSQSKHGFQRKGEYERTQQVHFKPEVFNALTIAVDQRVLGYCSFL
jgi:hypothetical protein